jgi:hypothetical protein
MVGTGLVPLSTLQQALPEMGEQKGAKYRGREHVAAIYIPCLSCTWVDVIQMFAVSPKLIQERRRLVGDPMRPFFEIESDSLDIDRLCVYYRNDKETGEPIFDPFDPALPLDRPGEGFEEWYREEAAKGHRLRTFVGIPHILYKGEIDISNCPIVY